MTEQRTPMVESAPVLIKWAIKYDDVFNMPEYAQGTYISAGAKTDLNIPSGEFIRIHDVEVFDMFNKFLITSTGQKFYLSGSGSRMFLVDNERVAQMQMEKMAEYDDEDFD